MDETRYYLSNEVVSTFSTASEKCIHLNTRSVKNEVLCLEFFAGLSFKFSAIMLTETWSTCDYDVFRLKDYTTYYVNRQNVRGEALLLSNDVQGQILESYTVITRDYEILSVCTQSTVFSVCYRPPDSNISSFLQFYDLFLASVVQCHHQKTLIACGDFNIDMSIPSPSARDFNTTFMSNGFVNLINIPTRVTSESHSVLDLIITNAMQTNVISGALSCCISDHLPVFA